MDDGSDLTSTILASPKSPLLTQVDSAFRLVKSFCDAQHIDLRPRSTTLNETEHQALLNRIGDEAKLDEHIWKRFR
jgi:hypothetical protein